MWWLIAILGVIAGVSVWSLRKKSLDRDLRKQVGFLSLASSFVSFLIWLLMLFDFLEAKRGGYLEEFVVRTDLMTATTSLFFVCCVHLTMSGISFWGVVRASK